MGWSRRLLRLHIAAPAAGAQIDTGVERLDGGLEIGLDIGDMRGDLVLDSVGRSLYTRATGVESTWWVADM